MRTYRDTDGEEWSITTFQGTVAAMVPLGFSGDRPLTHTFIQFRRTRDGIERHSEIPTLDWDREEAIRAAFERSEQAPHVRTGPAS